MDLELKSRTEGDSNKIVLVCTIGLLEALKAKLLTTNECEQYLFSPYSVSILNRKGIDRKVVEIIEFACELEDVESLRPERLDSNIDYLINKAKERLKSIEFDPNFNIKRKWLNEDQ
ncbi:DUF3969 family protein [Enterococcus pallens]|uniref:DUF3969 family protein n=1 Tax=Enterococcus pallens ATCC BAA-351 TaxID=1158607 RepID=R2QJJ4_9ENTE|nr:DUF3969 family protein [Enterococcus pallens]EOH95348.1 hypothetical protein UAU_01310 [Enterococcus pallens ATCC BAA-351]EOU21515.1 hypothetical protein I588_02362 [Enterococcus pallens ATCC BAA-351]